MPTVKVGEAIRLVEADGWRMVRHTGSHRHFQHPTKPGTITIAGKPSATLHPKTWANIRRTAGL